MLKSLEKEDILEELGFKGHGTHQCGHKDRDRPWEGAGTDQTRSWWTGQIER